MIIEELNSVEHWWSHSRGTDKFPGTSALWVGAGISIEAPTCLPNGAVLTEALIRHLLPDSTASEILAVFEQCEPVLRRSLPRLEHVLDRTCNVSAIEDFSRATNPKNLLRLFETRIPNNNHHVIAEHLLRTKGWCITTNFDDCIEQASAHRIPVHIIHPDGKQIEILYREYGENWGLVKLHGTISQGVENLGATLKDLQLGLPEAMRALLTDIMTTVDATIVAGYSGTDHFDVNHWIRDRLNSRNSSKLIWISHSFETEDHDDFDEDIEPWASWGSAFAGMNVERGQTNRILSRLIGSSINHDMEILGSQELSTLDEQLQTLYTPSKAERHLNGARLAASVGLGQLADEELRSFRYELQNESAAQSMSPEVFFIQGMKKEALELHSHLTRLQTTAISITRTRLLRHRGLKITAIIRLLLTQTIWPRKLLDPAEKIEAIACALDVVENLQSTSLFRARATRKLIDATMNLLYNITALPDANELPIALQGKLQTQNVRRFALLADDENEREFLGKLWLLVKEQRSAPDFYTEDGPLIPGYFLIEQSTAREEDRLADLVEINLELATILLSAIRRRWPKGIESLNEDSQKKGRRTTRSRFSQGQGCVDVVVELLFDSTRIATALSEHGLQVAIAECWIKAERVLGGISYWKRQRLFLPRYIAAEKPDN
ncbi:SIR2 family protein [Collimonas arenae]|nr:SIR2 family protein [Collimonas arenae]